MTNELALFLGAYMSEGHTTRSNWSVIVTNSVRDVLVEVQRSLDVSFGLEARMTAYRDRCPGLVVSSKRLVEWMELISCGSRAANKTVPEVILQGTRSHALRFLQGAALDAYTTHQYAGKWAICLESREAIDQLQVLLTRLGIVNSQIAKFNRQYNKTYFELYAAGPWGQRLSAMAPFLEPDKAERAALYLSRPYRTALTDRIPGISGRELYDALPRGRSGRYGAGTGRQRFRHLVDARTQRVTRASVLLARDAGAVLPAWLTHVLEQEIRFVEVLATRSRH